MSGFTAMLLDDPDGQPFRAPARDAEDVVAISYTSGTTGRPKGVAMTHRNVNSAVENTRRMYFAVTSELRGHRNLISVPLLHVTGCHTQMVTALATGGTCVVMPSFTVSSLIDLIAREHISILISLPTIFSRMLEAPGADAVDVSYVRGIMFGGAPVPPRLVRALRAKFPAARLVNGFGATESTAVLTALPDEYAASQQDPQVRPAAGHRLGQRLAPFGAATEYTAARRRPSYLCSTPVTHPQGDLVSTAPHHHDLPSRVVIAGTTDDGRSCVDIDGPTPHRVVTPVATLNDLWVSDSVPTPFTPAFAGSSEEYSVVPPTTGLKVLVAIFPPDNQWKEEAAAYAAALATTGAADSDDDHAAGSHRTDTVDVVTVLEGELHAVLETTEVVLKAGNTFVQTGGGHAWSNRTDRPVKAVLTMIDASQ